MSPNGTPVICKKLPNTIMGCGKCQFIGTDECVDCMECCEDDREDKKNVNFRKISYGRKRSKAKSNIRTR